MKIFFLKTLVFVLLFYVSDIFLGSIFSYFHLETKNINLYNANHGFVNYKNEEVLFFGGSEISHSLVSNIIKDSLGVSCFNLGSDACGIFYQYPLLSTILKKNSPKVILISAMQLNERSIDYITRMYPYYRNNHDVKSIVDEFFLNENIKLLLNGYVYNSQIFRVFDTANSDNILKLNGYCPLLVKGKLPLSKSKVVKLSEGENYPISNKTIFYFRKFINKAVSSGAKVYILIPPVLEKIDSNYHNRLMNLTKFKDVSVLDYSRDSCFLKYPELYNDKIHLNQNGAKLLTEKFLRVLKKDSIMIKNYN
jgi:hypothetical protein